MSTQKLKIPYKMAIPIAISIQYIILEWQLEKLRNIFKNSKITSPACNMLKY